MSQAAPRASVIVPTWESFASKKGSVELVLASLFRQNVDGFEIIVADDGSPDGTAERLERFRRERPRHVSFRLLRLRHTGNRSTVRNRGVRLSRSNVLVFMDDDTLFLSDDGLGRLVGSVRRGAFACGAARHWSHLDWDSRTVGERLRAGDYRSLEGRSLCPRGLKTGSQGFSAEYSYISNCGAVHRSDFLKLGGFEEEGYGGWGLEDVDLMLRLLVAGARLVNVHEAIRVLHLTHPMDAAGHGRKEENVRRYRLRERELGYRLDGHRLFGVSKGRILRPLKGRVR